MRFVVLALVSTACGRFDFEPQGDVGDVDAVAAPVPDVWFKLDESSGQRVRDSADTYNGWVTDPSNATWQPAGVVGGAMHFNGPAGGFVLFPAVDVSVCTSTVAFPQSLTVATWVNFDQFGLNDASLSDFAIANGTSGGTDGGWGLGATDGCGPHVVGATVAEPSGQNRAIRCGATPLAARVWYHIAFVYDSDARTLEVYLDGRVDSASFTPGSIPVPASLHVPTQGCGSLAAPTNQYNQLVGSLDDVRIYRRALSASEIASIHAAAGT